MSSLAGFAEVVVELTNRRLDRTFHYAIPDSLQTQIQLGSKVLVPFGYRKVTGIVVGFVPKPEVEEVKEIIEVHGQEPVLTQELLQLAQWMAEYYLCPLSLVLQAIIPAIGETNRASKELGVALRPGLDKATLLERLKRAPKQTVVVDELLTQSPQPIKELLKKTNTTRALLKTLEEKGIVEFVELNNPPQIAALTITKLPDFVPS